MLKKDFFATLGIILLALAIGLSPYLTVAQLADGRAVKIRIEDLVISVLLVISFLGFLAAGKKEIKKPPLMLLMLAWLCINFTSTLADVVLNNLYITRSFFYFLKEIEFFAIYWYVFYYLKSIDAVKWVTGSWMLVGLVNAGFVMYEMAIHNTTFAYYYGQNSFIEPDGTVASAGFFLLIFLFLFNIFLHYYSSAKLSPLKKLGLLVLCTLPLVGIFSSGSRSTFLSFIPALGCTLLIYLFKKAGSVKRFLLIVLVLGVAAGTFFAVFANSPQLVRLVSVKGFDYELNANNDGSRLSIWRDQVSAFVQKPVYLVWGFGTGVVLAFGESHSQYVRNLVEAGFLGSLVFLLLMGAIFKKTWHGIKTQDNFLAGMSAGLFCATVAMLCISLSTEPFIVVKLSEAYWFFAAMTFAYAHLLHKPSSITA